jgi:hypothetical protein
MYHFLKFLLNLRSFREYQFCTFDLLKPLPSNALDKLNSLLESEDHFRPLQIRVSDGTLLGLARDSCLIKHDNDIDFDVVWSKSAEKVIHQLAKSKNWTLIRKVVFHGRIQQLAYYDQDEVIFDFIFWVADKRFCINFSEPGCYRVMPSSFLNDLMEKEINGVCYKIPVKIEEWLVYRYGSDWNVPQLQKGDWKLDCGDIGNAWWME